MAPRLKLTNEQVEKMKKEFLLLDVDGDGTITVNELESVLRTLTKKLEVSEDDIKRTLKELDQDGDGTIDLEEYANSRNHKTDRDLLHRALVTRSKIRTEFKMYDRNHSGYVSKGELIQAIKARTGITITLEHIEKIIEDIDTNEDGKVNYEEFVLLMSK